MYFPFVRNVSQFCLRFNSNLDLTVETDFIKKLVCLVGKVSCL